MVESSYTSAGTPHAPAVQHSTCLHDASKWTRSAERTSRKCGATGGSKAPSTATAAATEMARRPSTYVICGIIARLTLGCPVTATSRRV